MPRESSKTHKNTPAEQPSSPRNGHIDKDNDGTRTIKKKIRIRRDPGTENPEAATDVRTTAVTGTMFSVLLSVLTAVVCVYLYH